MSRIQDIQELRRFYRQFLEIQRDILVAYVRKAKGADGTDNLNDQAIEKIYDAYYRPSFFVFLRDLKTAIYSASIFDFVKIIARDSEYGAGFVEFFEKTKLAKLDKNGKVIVLKKDLLSMLPRVQSEEEIKSTIERKLGVKIKANASVTDLLKNIKVFRTKSKFDQLPISQATAIFEVKKILENLPLPETFLFVGDDDFISVLLSFADPNISSLVIDADEELLASIKNIAAKYALNIRVKRADASGKNVVREPIVGFLCNPPYTYKGVKTFVKYGVKNFAKDGGFVILTVGDEAVGHRFLALQNFFTKENLMIREIAKGAAAYPFTELYPSDTVVKKKFLAAGISEETIKTAPHLGASVYVLDYIPYKVPQDKLRQSIYTYL
ncbi:MAG: bis-aminopropyl spermidine synthase family protein [Candidatus Wildermuthbacteria bacterium]|nr:bis-aminopropyl spermidine synthase family protein [Candidatus Wildermuthbacteria bacterium]